MHANNPISVKLGLVKYIHVSGKKMRAIHLVDFIASFSVEEFHLLEKCEFRNVKGPGSRDPFHCTTLGLLHRIILDILI